MLHKKYCIVSMFALCNILFTVPMETPAPAAAHQVFVLVVDYDHVICLHDAQCPGQLQLPGGIVGFDKSPGIIARKHLEEQTGIGIPLDYLDLIAQSTRFDVNKKKFLEQYYYLVENRGLQPTKEDSDDLYAINRSVNELAEAKPYLPRDHTKPSLAVGIVLQKIAQHIKTGCKGWDLQEVLENKSKQDNKTQLELFPKNSKPS